MLGFCLMQSTSWAMGTEVSNESERFKMHASSKEQQQTMEFLGSRCNDDMLPALQAVLEDLTPHILSFLDVPTL
eukprot:scaffold340938_cov31-Attheya_sp.AAC.1